MAVYQTWVAGGVLIGKRRGMLYLLLFLAYHVYVVAGMKSRVALQRPNVCDVVVPSSTVGADLSLHLEISIT